MSNQKIIQKKYEVGNQTWMKKLENHISSFLFFNRQPQLQPLRCMEEQKLQLAGKDNGSMMLEAVGEACCGKIQQNILF